jgi:hypothetical protein
MTRHLPIYIFGLLMLVSCNEPQGESSTIQRTQNFAKSSPNIPETYDRYCGIATTNCGPRGGVLINSSGNRLPYRLFRIQIINDTLCPVELNLTFPGKPLTQYPDTNQSLRVFLFPDELTPDTIQDVYNFGVRGLESFLDTGLNKPTTLTKLIQPRGEYILYIGCITDELARAKFFFNGQHPDLSYLPVKPVVGNTKNKNVLDCIFGVWINPPQNYSSIHCGQIVFKK